jgi:hypothetical protein
MPQQQRNAPSKTPRIKIPWPTKLVVTLIMLACVALLILAVQNVMDPFSATPTSGVVPVYVNFSYADSNPDRRYTIDFGDGSSGALTVAPPIPAHCTGSEGWAQVEGCGTSQYYIALHVYTSRGTYVARVKDASGTARGSVTITAE